LKDFFDELVTIMVFI